MYINCGGASRCHFYVWLSAVKLRQIGGDRNGMQPGGTTGLLIMRRWKKQHLNPRRRGDGVASRWRTLHHEDDIRVQRRVEEVNKGLGSELGSPGARSVSASLNTHTRTHGQHEKEAEAGKTQLTFQVPVSIKIPVLCRCLSSARWNTDGPLATPAYSLPNILLLHAGDMGELDYVREKLDLWAAAPYFSASYSVSLSLFRIFRHLKRDICRVKVRGKHS